MGSSTNRPGDATTARVMRRRGTLTPVGGYAVAAYVIFLGFFASVAPSPLYQTYMERYGFSSVTLTLVYATYAVGVLVALLVAGRVSDDVGRRPVLLTALAVLACSTVMLLTAASTAWLFVARAIGGLATGAAISSAGAALVDLQPRQDGRVVAVTNGVASNTGLGIAILVVSALILAGWAPLIVPFVALLCLLGAAAIGVFLMPDPVKVRKRLRLRLERPSVPRVVRGPFLLASLAVVSSWSIAGLFFSLGPQLGSYLFETNNPVVANSGILALLGTAAVAQLVFGYARPWLGASLGCAALSAGMAFIVTATATRSGALYLAGSVLGGLGFGVAFLSGLRGLVASIPPGSRAEVMAAFYVVAYTSLSVPAVMAGLLVGEVGLATTFEVFGASAAVLALTVAVGALTTRPSVTVDDDSSAIGSVLLDVGEDDPDPARG